VAENVTCGPVNCKTPAWKDARVVSEGAIRIISRKKLLKHRMAPKRGTGEVTGLAVRKPTRKRALCSESDILRSSGSHIEYED
jgi:hypothetical protein